MVVGGVPPQHEGQIGDRQTELERPGAWSWGGEQDGFINVWLVISSNLRGCSKSVELDSIMGWDSFKPSGLYSRSNARLGDRADKIRGRMED